MNTNFVYVESVYSLARSVSASRRKVNQETFDAKEIDFLLEQAASVFKNLLEPSIKFNLFAID